MTSPHPIVRLADYGDTDCIVDMCMAMFAEMPRIVPISEDCVRAYLNEALPNGRNDPNAGSAWVGVIGDPGRLVGSVGLVIKSEWCSPVPYIEQTWSFVRPEFRAKTPCTAELISFSKTKADELQSVIVAPRTLPVMDRFYARAGWQQLTTVYRYAPEGMMP